MVLATVCVRYLKFLNCGTTISANADEEDNSIAGSHDFLSYSARNWTTHFRKAGIIPTAALLSSALKICDPNLNSYAAWSSIFWDWETIGWGKKPKHFSNIMLVSYCGLYAIAKALVEQDVDVDVDSKDPNYGRTPLSWAAESGHEEVVKLLIQTGKVDANSEDSEYGQTPLLWAVQNGHKEVVKLLNQTGKVDVDSEDSKYSQTPLPWFAEIGYEEFVSLPYD
jgi:hypothetical protein